MTIEALKFLSPKEVSNIACNFGSPVFVYDFDNLNKNYMFLDNMPTAFGTTIRYSVKSNPNKSILSIFNTLGAHFDVSSIYEAERCINAGVEPSKILMTAQEASDGWIDLCSKGMIFDAGSIGQLEAYGQNFPNTNASIRINPGFGSGLVKKLTTGGDHSSFGIWIEHLDKVKALILKYNLKVNRLHVHIGSGHEGKILQDTVKTILNLCIQLPTVEIINLGGGYRTKTFKCENEYDHCSTFQYIKELLLDFAKDNGRQLKLEIEPGTYLVSLTGSLITKIVDVVTTSRNSPFIKINAGLTELIRPSYYHVLHPLIVVNKNGELPLDYAEYYISGHCCIAGDNLSPKPGDSDDLLPIKLGNAAANDYLVIERCGGYAASMSLKNFNSFPETTEILRLAADKYIIIRNKQTVAHMTQNEVQLNFSNIKGVLNYEKS